MRQTRLNEVLETAVRQLLEHIQIVTESDSECTHEILRVQLLSLVDYALDSFGDAFEVCIGFFASQDILQICALDKTLQDCLTYENLSGLSLGYQCLFRRAHCSARITRYSEGAALRVKIGSSTASPPTSAACACYVQVDCLRVA